MGRGLPWTKSEEKSFKVDYPQMNVNAMQDKYKRSAFALKQKAKKLGIHRNLIQSYDIKVFDNEGEIIYDYNIPRSVAANTTKASILKRLSTMNDKAIERGEWILSITHNLECYEP